MKNRGHLTDMEAVMLGSNIRKQREKLNIKRAEFAESIDISLDYLGKIERGAEIPSLYITVKIANLLNVSVDNLLDEYFFVERVQTDVQKQLINRIYKLDEKDTLFINEFINLYLKQKE